MKFQDLPIMTPFKAEAYGINERLDLHVGESDVTYEEYICYKLSKHITVQFITYNPKRRIFNMDMNVITDEGLVGFVDVDPKHNYLLCEKERANV